MPTLPVPLWLTQLHRVCLGFHGFLLLGVDYDGLKLVIHTKRLC